MVEIVAGPNEPSIATYQAMIFDLRKALAEQFPERKDIYIIDDTRRADGPDGEIARAAKALGIPDLDKQLKRYKEKNYPHASGVTLSARDRNGNSVSVCFGWGYGYGLHKLSSNAPLPSKSPPLDDLVQTQVHELTHGLMNTEEFPGYMGNRKFHESRADVVAADVVMRHNLKNWAKISGEMACKDAPAFLNSNYDASEGIGILKRRFYPTPSEYRPQDFRGFTHLRDSYERSLKMMEETSQIHELDPAMEAISDKLVARLKNRPKSDPSKATSDLSSVMIAFAQEHQEIFPQLSKRALDAAAACKTHMNNFSNKTDTAIDYVPPLRIKTYDKQRAMAAAWIKASKSTDPLDKKIAEALFRQLMPEGDNEGIYTPPLDNPQQQAILAHPKETAWAQRILNGEKLDAVFPEMRKLADSYLTPSSIPKVKPPNPKPGRTTTP